MKLEWLLATERTSILQAEDGGQQHALDKVSFVHPRAANSSSRPAAWPHAASHLHDSEPALIACRAALLHAVRQRTHSHLSALQVAWRHADQIQSTQTWELVKDFRIELDPIAQRLLAGDSYQGIPEVLDDVEDACSTAAQHFSDAQVGPTIVVAHSASLVGQVTHDVPCSCLASPTCLVLGM